MKAVVKTRYAKVMDWFSEQRLAWILPLAGALLFIARLEATSSAQVERVTELKADTQIRLEQVHSELQSEQTLLKERILDSLDRIAKAQERQEGKIDTHSSDIQNLSSDIGTVCDKLKAHCRSK